MYKPQQAQAFYEALAGMANPPLTFQTFYDPDSTDETKKQLATWRYSVLNPEWLASYQSHGCGVFACVNGSSKGGRHRDDIDIFRAVFVDSDGAALPAQWVVEPHALVMRDPTHWHAYWFIDGQCTAEEWSLAQMHMAIYYGGDQKIFNPDRVMRVPGFFHQKNLSAPALYELVSLRTDIPRHNLRKLLASFPLHNGKAEALGEWIRKRAEKRSAGIGDFDDCEANQARYIDYLINRSDISVQGQGGNHVAFKTACAGVDYGLSPEKTYELMRLHWDDRCVPPWGEEVWGVVCNAYRYKQNAVGSRSASILLNQPALSLPGMSLEPSGEVVYERPASDAVAPTPATAGKAPSPPRGDINPADIADDAGMYGKNHTQNALTFLSQYAPNGEMFIYEDDIYRYNGKVYVREDDNLVGTLMNDAMTHCFPSASDLNGSVSMAKYRLRKMAPSRWPEWKTDPDRDTRGLIVFNNGILDILTNQWFEHTHDLRARHVLPYDYDYTATCPNWEEFLFSVWGDSPYEPLIELLQQWFGYMLADDQSQQKMAIVTGKPRSGKGTIMRVARSMIGEFNCADPSLENLTKDSILHGMSDKLVAFFNDVSSPSSSSRNTIVSNIKRIVGQDAVSFDRKYKSSVSTGFKCRLFMSSNAIPNLSESSSAMIDRGLFFYTPRSFAGKEDIGLQDKLNEEMPGIINWAIQGLIALRRNGRLQNHPCMASRIDLFQLHTSPLDAFARKELVLDPKAWEPLEEVYARFIGWSANFEGSGRRSMSNFARDIDAMRSIELDMLDGRQVLRGCRLVPHHEEPPEGSLP